MAHKYHAQPTVVDGIRFASKKEAMRYGELKLLDKAGEIRKLELQPSFPLHMWRPDHSDLRQVAVYRGDFSYEARQSDGDGNGWLPIVEDVKGMRTPIYRLKKKMVEAEYGIEIREV